MLRGPRKVPPFIISVLVALPLSAADRRGSSRSWCGTYPAGTRDALWAHREAALGRGPVRLSADRRLDVGQIAVLLDEGDLVVKRNFMDLQGAGLEFRPQASEYRITRVDRPVAPESGNRLTLADDDSQAVALPFAFPFYGKSHSEVFVNSDGNLTFGEADKASTPRSLGRFLEGPPRIGPLFADLDPSAAGSVTTRAEADRFIVT